jgi:hypothetical protein
VNELIYLYGFIAADAEAPSALQGIGGSVVRVVSGDTIAAVVSDVPARDFDAAEIERRIEDIDWVGRRGLEHEHVVSWFVDHGDIVPVPIFTLYSGPEALRRDLAERRETVRQHLERLAGKREWDCKLACDLAQLTATIGAVSDPVRTLDAEIAAAQPGRQFLLERKRQELARAEAKSLAAERADALCRALAAVAEDHVRLTITRTRETLPVVLHAALLVRHEREHELAAALAEVMRELEPIGFAASLTGPWAPYRFVEGARAG